MNAARLAPFLFLTAGACRDLPTDVCRDPERIPPLVAGILVIALDAVTNQNITSGAKIVARQSATVADSITSAASNSVYVGKVIGNYTVTVSRTGYQTFSRANVDLAADVCGFVPVQVTAVLQPE